MKERGDTLISMYLESINRVHLYHIMREGGHTLISTYLALTGYIGHKRERGGVVGASSMYLALTVYIYNNLIGMYLRITHVKGMYTNENTQYLDYKLYLLLLLGFFGQLAIAHNYVLEQFSLKISKDEKSTTLANKHSYTSRLLSGFSATGGKSVFLK